MANEVMTAYEVVLFDLHGSELNGFVLLGGTRAKLDAIRASDELNTMAPYRPRLEKGCVD
jgi:hypothetical protein